MRRRDLLILLGGTLPIWPLAGNALQSEKVWRIGYLSGRSRPASLEADVNSAFLTGMRDFGYTEGKDFVMEWRFADGHLERWPGLASDLVRLNVDVIVAISTGAVRAAQQATTTIPIVIGYASDPVSNSLVASLARPGANTTGLATLLTDITAKHLELLTTAVPGLSRIALLWNPSNAGHPDVLKGFQVAARQAGVTALPAEARNIEEIEAAFREMTDQRAGALVVLTDPLFNSNEKRVTELALKHRLPSIHANREYAEAGGLMSYGDSLTYFFRRAAFYVDKILKGTKPGDLPIEQPTTFQLVINLKTANALGLTISPSLIARADTVIE